MTTRSGRARFGCSLDLAHVCLAGLMRRRWIGLWGGLSSVLGSALASDAAVLSLTFLCLGLLIRPIRSSWRPISGWVGLAVSLCLRPGDRAWYVRSRDAT